MTTRLLPRDEWDRLKGTEAESVAPILPGHAHVLVVERNGAIVGSWIFVVVPHVECLWKRADAGAGVSKQLLKGMKAIMKSEGAKAVVTAADSDLVRSLLEHQGATPLLGQHFVLELA